MSIIPRRSVNVFPMIVERDPDYNNWVKRRAPQPTLVDDVTIEDVSDRTRDPEELDLTDVKVIRGKGTWPGGVHSIVEIDGEEYDQIGKVKKRQTGYYTKHFEVRIAARGAEVK